MTENPPETGRLTRDEQRARTRRDLLAAAATVFARHGYHGTSVDQVAEAAGYTKGAVYSNFSSKEELFLALFDEHVDQAITSLAELLHQAPASQRADMIGERHHKLRVMDRDWFLLEAEFELYAARNEAVRERIAERQRRTLRRVAEIVEQHFSDLGIDPDAISPTDVARILIAVSDGLSLGHLTQPEVDSASLMTLLVTLMERGARNNA
jgi:AcrR family transcriptional regulator